MSPEEEQLLSVIRMRKQWLYRELLERSDDRHKGFLPARIARLKKAGLIEETGELIIATERDRR